ncbi:MAG: sulfatase [Elusimicrobiales bacterium]|jgi:arylsulfatase A-like enzyme
MPNLSKKIRSVLSGGLILLAFPPLQAAGNRAAASGRPGYNIILVVADCLRADHLSLYGYRRATSPNLDAFAAGAAVFRHAEAQAPTTLLSFASIFTSLEVSAHGVDSIGKALSDSVLTLAGILKIYGYRTAAFVGGHNLNPLFKLDRGFEVYSHLNRTDASFKDTLPAALKWAEEKKERNEKFFLVAHGNDLHTPYVFPASSLYDRDFQVSGPLKAMRKTEAGIFAACNRRLRLGRGKGGMILTDDDAAHLTARYDEGINYSDGLLGAFLDRLRSERLLDRTVVVLTADHGEGLFDHDYFFHDFNLYEDTLRVPLIIKVPDAGHREIDRRVRLIDLMPTILDLAGIPPDASAQGRSLKFLLTDGTDPGREPAVFSESAVGGKVIYSGRWKLIRTPRKTELYDLERDPGEKRDLAGSERETVEALEGALSARLASDAAASPGPVLPAGSRFSADMQRAAAELKEIYREIGGPDAAERR